MKRFLSILFFCPALVFGQVSENFENAHLLQWDQFPLDRWTCTDLDPLQGSYSLRHNFDNTESGVDRISYYFKDIDLKRPIRWEFLMKYEYNPSSTNNWNVFLLANMPAEFMDKGSEINALILGVNYTGSDDYVCLYKQNSEGIEKLLTTTLNWQDLEDQDVYRFIINYYEDHHFSIEGGLNDTVLLGTTESVDPGFDYANFFGLRYSYTSSKDKLLSMDDVRVSGTYFTDTLAPVLESLEYPDRFSLKIEFSEDVYISDDFNILINNQVQPDSMEIIGGTIILYFQEEFINHMNYELSISGLTDRKLNELKTNWNFIFFIPGRGDIRISEIMADPSPQVYLPDYEFIELYNNSSENINLENWVISVNSKQITLPEIILKNEEYCLLSHPDFTFGETFFPVLNSIYSIPNEGCEIILKNTEDEIIDALDFSLSWHEEEYKQEGGWSLERIDLSAECSGEENWTSSISGLGGTPLKENSVSFILPEIDPFFVNSIAYCGGNDFKINFNRQPQENKFLDLTNYRLVNGSGQLLNVSAKEPLRKSYFFHFDKTDPAYPLMMLFDGVVNDCFGYEYLMRDTLKFGIPCKISPFDILITEVMFDPNPGSAEFIEIYNRSDKVINLYELTLETGTTDEELHGGKFISEDSTLFFPGEYLVLSKYPGDLIQYFNSSLYARFHYTSNFPSLNNTDGKISLKDRAGNIIDEMCYSNNDHFPYLSLEKGASLERLDLMPCSGLDSEWHTASSLMNFGTPGFLNSQYTGVNKANSKIEREKSFFTPNNDGMDDLAILNYDLEKEGILGSVIIFDASGRLVNILYQHELLGTGGRFYWDGRNSEGSICGTGIYLFYIELIHLEGYKESFKKTVSLIHPVP